MPDNYLKARLFLWEGNVLFFGPLSDNTAHSHHAAQITIGLDGPFRLKQGGVSHQTRAVAIPPNQRHQLDGGQNRLAIALIDGASDLGRTIAAGDFSPACDHLNDIPATLSQSRFLHLFKETTGLSLRRYILWRRIINSIEAAGQGADLTSAAHKGGVADSAHFSRTFRKTFGLSPSKLLKNSQNIQVITR